MTIQQTLSLGDQGTGFTLRPYQSGAGAAIKDGLSRGVTRLLVAMATGLGKTVVFAALPNILELKGRMLVLAHRQELQRVLSKS